MVVGTLEIQCSKRYLRVSECGVRATVVETMNVKEAPTRVPPDMAASARAPAAKLKAENMLVIPSLKFSTTHTA